MNRRKPQERRQYPRINSVVPVNIIANGYDFVTSTQNVSCVGAYCHVSKYIPPFTRIAVKLRLPIASGNQSKNHSVECKGVVVRSEDAQANGFNIAIFFNAIQSGQRKIISQYVKQFLPLQSPVAKRV